MQGRFQEMPAEMPAEMNDRMDRWKARLSRASELSRQHPAAAPALQLYQATLEFQSQVARRCNPPLRPHIPFREQIELAALSGEVASILAVAEAHGPAQLCQEAQRLRQSGEDSWRKIMSATLDGHSVLSASADFFARACLQPVAENLQQQMSRDANYLG